MLLKIGRIFILSLFFFTVSCKTISYEWGNFTAYYNTFYNANLYFEKGFESVLKAQQALNTEKPIRVTESPNKAGFTDLEKAIEKGAKILREYNKTKWVDDALFLIGKAYFYEMNYFSAEEKFKELYVNTQEPSLKQSAIFFIALSKYEIRRFDEALDFISEELSAADNEWIPEKKSLVQLVEAEIYTELKDFYKANELLGECLPHLKNGEYKARGWYLKGQLQERLNQNQNALQSYSRVKDFTNEYNLQFLAKRKQAEIARTSGNFTKALELYTDMSKDGKNYDIISELNYEIAKTLELKKDYNRAEAIYKDILYNKLVVPKKETAAKAYYGLAVIYRDYHQNFTLTAQYFDSANTRGSSSLLLPEWFNASELAKDYGEFSRLNKKNKRYDSLLYLSSLSQTQLDSVLQEIQLKRKVELDALKKEQEKHSSTLININAPSSNPTNPNLQDGAQPSQNGFMNHKNPYLVQQMAEQFNAYWGKRPLVDNWRRFDAIKNVAVSNESSNQSTLSNKKKELDQTLQALKIDLNEIPFDSTKKAAMKKDFSVSLYETGNVYYLSLNLPDSAKRYYYRVIKDFPKATIVPQAKYSLTEILNAEGKSILAKDIAQSVITDYPESTFAMLLAAKYGIEFQDSLQNISNTPENELSKFITDSTDLPLHEKAETLKKLASKFNDPEKSSQLLHKASSLYIEAAKQTPKFWEKVSAFEKQKFDLQSKEEKLKQLKDSIKVQLSDSLVKSDTLLVKRYKKVLDSVLVKPDLALTFPYVGTFWDSTRTVLQTLSSKYGASLSSKKTEGLRLELALPESLKKVKVDTSKTEVKKDTSTQTEDDL